MTKRFALVLGLATLAGCSAVKNSTIRPDYEQVDKQRVKRLVVVTAPLPDGKQALGDMWSLIARQYINQNRDFLVKEHITRAESTDDAALKALCVEGLEGVLLLDPQVKRTGDGADVAVRARLMRCADGENVWSAEAAGGWDSVDEKFRERTAQYVQQFGAEVEPYVVPSYKLLQATLDTLPNPQLNDQDIDEKIELGE
ncbi:MXAN_6521/LA_1396 family lipoprotein [Hyalangium rubrum]|uniref:MXAN_6521/LA_1396 family lipoprotein n=1 Tax=Hyalangium rubrum TaxID=3103134 RepID=A0ABU5H352_9BACT|nr:MXAN_6521/LA_1396 family lipoprotein [Hyalangium sp. s54d21]MDY7227529.1 MXAN_6521/LA_1396 family lipoprotein [Hyalangium sp. s54d21]